jgi:hypothetical protein
MAQGLQPPFISNSSIPSGFLIDGEGKIVAQGGQLRGMNLHLAIEKQLK